MELGIDIKKINQTLSLKKIQRNFPEFVSRQTNLFLYLLIILMAAFFVYMWYVCLYRPDWSEERKQEYIKSKDKSIIFNKNKFEEVIAESEIRKSELQKDLDKPEDIYRLKK